jgi:2-polyprenyl-3-methyl-5-hydroxy-6-metoxy-1,4-benzoquinol methylase
MDLKELPFHAFARHPWEIVRADFFLRLLRDRVKGNDLSALDLGAGDAYFARRLVGALPAVSRMTCFDLAYDARWLADRADAENSVDKLGEIQFTSTKPDERFDLIVMLDVLEHTADDRAALREATSSLLKPGGWLLLSVPAWPALFSRHDETLGHHRRYTPARLRALVAEANLTTAVQGELFASLLVPRAFATLGEIAFGGGKRTDGMVQAPADTSLSKWKRGTWVTLAVKTALTLDATCCQVAARLRLPFAGLSTWVLARMP